jgi:hypothetical protein
VPKGATLATVPFTAPTPLRVSDEAPLTLHWIDEDCPACIVDGEALRFWITGGGEDGAATFTVATPDLVGSELLVTVIVAVPGTLGAV